jgi:hypothetical protein
MQLRELVNAVNAIAQEIHGEVRSCGKVSDQSSKTLDGLLLACHQLGIINDQVFLLELKDLRYWYEVDKRPEEEWFHGLNSGLLWRNWDQLVLKCDVKQLVAPDRDQNRKDRYSEETSVFAKEFAKWLSKAEPAYIAKELNGKRADIFRFLLDKPRGVSFSTFQEARSPVTGQRITESRNLNSTKTMLYSLSRQLADYGYEISASIPNDLIKMKRYA